MLGCLMEKQRTTPDAYPLSVNALRLACNQATNRDPVVDYDERTVRDAAQRLGQRGWARFVSGPGSRAPKYRHTFDSALDLSDEDVAVLCLLMLRGAQTPGELKGRSDRLHSFPDLRSVEATLDRLIERELVRRLDRRPGQKEQRYLQLVGGDPTGEDTDRSPTPAAAQSAGDSLEERVARLEKEVRGLRESLHALERART